MYPGSGNTRATLISGAKSCRRFVRVILFPPLISPIFKSFPTSRRQREPSWLPEGRPRRDPKATRHERKREERREKEEIARGNAKGRNKAIYIYSQRNFRCSCLSPLPGAIICHLRTSAAAGGEALDCISLFFFPLFARRKGGISGRGEAFIFLSFVFLKLLFFIILLSLYLSLLLVFSVFPTVLCAVIDLFSWSFTLFYWAACSSCLHYSRDNIYAIHNTSKFTWESPHGQ